MFLVPISSISSHHWRNTFFGAFGVDSIWMPLEKSLVHYFLCHCPRVLSYCLQRKQGILFFSVKIGLIERRIYEHIAPERKKFIAILTQCRKAESRIFELYGTCNGRRSPIEDRSGLLVRVILRTPRHGCQSNFLQARLLRRRNKGSAIQYERNVKDLICALHFHI